MKTTRRSFCTQAASLLATQRMVAQVIAGSTSRPDVAAIDHDRILTQADHALNAPVTPLTSFKTNQSPGLPNDYISDTPDRPDAFVEHRDALFSLGHTVPALTAAYAISHDERYAKRATTHLEAWFVLKDTAMTPSLELAQLTPGSKIGRPEGVIEGLSLVEIAQSVPFLARSESMSEASLEALTGWFIDYFEWLNTTRAAGLARDMHNHHGVSWLLQAAACARLNVKDDRALSALRYRFRSSTLRAQISFDGSLPRELSTPNPYRNSLFTLDLLAGACELLSTRFESVWTYELQDGPGMRAAMARHVPFIASRGSWPYPADAAYFNKLPLRRSSLLLAARAYSRPEYADLWRSLPADTEIAELDRTFPIRQPVLWVTRPRP